MHCFCFRLWFWSRMSEPRKWACKLLPGHYRREALPRRFRFVASIVVYSTVIILFRRSYLVWLFFQVIAKARVPIVKFVEKESGVAFDLRFNIVLLFLSFNDDLWRLHTCVSLLLVWVSLVPFCIFNYNLLSIHCMSTLLKCGNCEMSASLTCWNLEGMGRTAK